LNSALHASSCLCWLLYNIKPIVQWKGCLPKQPCAVVSWPSLSLGGRWLFSTKGWSSVSVNIPLKNPALCAKSWLCWLLYNIKPIVQWKGCLPKQPCAIVSRPSLSLGGRWLFSTKGWSSVSVNIPIKNPALCAKSWLSLCKILALLVIVQHQATSSVEWMPSKATLCCSVTAFFEPWGLGLQNYCLQNAVAVYKIPTKHVYKMPLSIFSCEKF